MKIVIDARAILIAIALLVSGATASANVTGNGSPGSSSGGGAVSSVSAGDGSITIGGTTANPTVAVSGTQPNANTWNGEQNFANILDVTGSPTGGCNGGAASAPVAPACVLTTDTVGLAFGPMTGSWNTGSANSSRLEFCKVLSGASACGAQIYYTSGGTFDITGANLSTNNFAFSTGTGKATTGQSLMGASCALSASGTMPAGAHGCKLTFTGVTSMTVTYASAYGTQAICETNDETTKNGSWASTCGTGSAIVQAASGDVVDFNLTGI